MDRVHKSVTLVSWIKVLSTDDNRAHVTENVTTLSLNITEKYSEKEELYANFC